MYQEYNYMPFYAPLFASVLILGLISSLTMSVDNAPRSVNCSHRSRSPITTAIPSPLMRFKGTSRTTVVMRRVRALVAPKRHERPCSDFYRQSYSFHCFFPPKMTHTATAETGDEKVAAQE